MYHRFHLDTGTHSLQGHEKQAFSPDCLWQSSCNSKYIKEPLEESSISSVPFHPAQASLNTASISCSSFSLSCFPGKSPMLDTSRVHPLCSCILAREQSWRKAHNFCISQHRACYSNKQSLDLRGLYF